MLKHAKSKEGRVHIFLKINVHYRLECFIIANIDADNKGLMWYKGKKNEDERNDRTQSPSE